MSRLGREAVFLALAAALTWWAFLRAPQRPAEAVARAPLAPPLALQLETEPAPAAPPAPRSAAEARPVAPAAPASSASAPDPEEQPPAERAPSELGAPEGTDGAKPVPPPPVDRPEAPAAMRAEPPPEPAGTAAQDPADRESGTEPDAAPLVGGAPDLAVTAAPPPVAAAPPPVTADPPPPAAPAPRPAAELRHDPRLLSLARAELAETTRHGFATVLLASPEEQIDIARSFGEALVLVPRDALDPSAASPRWFRLALDGTPRVESGTGRPPLERYRQYRDLFDYEYARLPEPLRALRRSVLSKSEIYLFAALVPLEEWAVVVGRRADALRASGRESDEVQRFLLRYVHAAGGGFDLAVQEIDFADGTRFVPAGTTAPEGPTAGRRP